MKLCLGTVQFGLEYGVQNNGRPGAQETDEILSEAIANRIHYFDTAAAYGNAEEVLGQYIESFPENTEQMKIISKLNPTAFESVSQNFWIDVALKNVQESLKKLKTERLAAYLFHNAAYIFNSEAVKALESVVVEGFSTTIGVSIYTPEEAMRALEYPQIGVIQIPYNVFDNRLDKCGFFVEARKKNVTVFARSSLLQGLLMMKPEALAPKMHFAKGHLSRFISLCEDFSVSPLKAAVCYAGTHPGIDYIVFGVDNRTQLSEYIALQREVLPKGMRETIAEVFDNVEERLVNPSMWNS